MFSLRRPDAKTLEQVRLRSAELSPSHAYLEADRCPAGYVRDHHRARLGSGPEAFARACQAVRDWQMLRLGWLEPAWPAAVAEGAVAGTLAQVFGMWALNVCRIVRVIDEERRFGFTYVTLAGHAECGQERFLVEWQAADDAVWYDLRAISRPGRLLTWLGYPLVRRLQQRFARDSLRVLRECAAAGGNAP